MKTRQLVCGTVLFILGIILAAAEIDILIFLVAAVISGGFVFRIRRAAFLCLVAVMVVFIGYTAMNCAKAERDKIVSRNAGSKEKLTLTITGFPDKGKVTARLKDKEGNPKVWLSVKSDIFLSPGDVVEGEITLRAPGKTKNSFSGYRENLAGNGIFLSAYADSVLIKGRERTFPMGIIYSLRTYINNLGEKYFDGDSRGLLNAMVFGDKTHLSDELYSALSASGLNHIAVVSGMHLSVMIAMLNLFVIFLFGKRRKGIAFSVIGAVFITLATGAGASVVRALIMSVMTLTAGFFYRESDSLTSLSFAACVMLLVNPFIIFNVGFILSVFSVLGIIILNRNLLHLFSPFVPEKVSKLLSASAAAQICVMPLVVYYFGVITPYALISNIFAVPLSSMYVTLGMIFCALSWIKPLAYVFVPLINIMSKGISGICYAFARLPYASVECKQPDGIFFLMCIALIAAIYLYPHSRKKFFYTMTVISAAIVVLSFMPKEIKMDITASTYGSRTMLSVESPDGGFLIDCPDSYAAGTESDGCVVMTTGDCGDLLENSGGLSLILPYDAIDEKQRRKISFYAEKAGTELFFLEDNERIDLCGCTVEYLPLDGVENSRALMVEYNGERLISLQGLGEKDLCLLKDSKKEFFCDYLALPFTAGKTDEFACLGGAEIISQ